MNEETAFKIGAQYNMTPHQSFLAYSAAENELESARKESVNEKVKSENSSSEDTINRRSYNSDNVKAKKKDGKKISEQYKKAIKSNKKGVTLLGTPKNSMQQAEINIINDFAHNKNFSVIIVDSINDITGVENNAMAVDGKIVIGLNSDNGMLLPYAGHELFHILKADKGSRALATELETFIINTLKSDDSFDYDARFNELQSLYNFKGSESEITAMINEEMAANACFSVLANENNFNTLVKQNKSLAQRVREFFSNFVKQLREKLATLSKSSAEYRALKDNINAQQKIIDMLNIALNSRQNKNTTDGGVKYALSENANNDVKKVLTDFSYTYDIQLTDNSPSIITSQKGTKNLPMVMKPSHIRENVFTAEEAKEKGLKVNNKIHYHGLGEQLFLDVIKDLEDVSVAYRGTKDAKNPTRRENYFILISQHKDNDGNIINVPVYIDEQSNVNRVFIETNKIATVFGKSDLYKWLQKQVSEGNLVRIKNKSTKVSEPSGTLPESYNNNASTDSISENKENVNIKNSLDIDSNGNTLSEQQTEFFKDSKVRDKNGNLLVLYHQTNADFTVFNFENQNAGKTDSDLPVGIFLKDNAKDIGLNGKKQIPLYANIVNPLSFKNRDDAVDYWKKHIKGYSDLYDELKAIDESFQKQYNAADVLEDVIYKEAFEQYKKGKITSNEFKEKLEETETKKILNEWTNKSNSLRESLKQFINQYIDKSQYDGLIIENDEGSFGRKIKTYIAFNSNQVKNIDNTNPTTNPDIRYSKKQITQTEKLLEENAQLHEANEILRQELQLTKGHKLNQNDIRKIANNLIKTYGAISIDNQLLENRLTSLYDYIANAGSDIDDSYIWTFASDIGRSIAKASTTKDTSFYDEYKPLKKKIRETAITVPSNVRKEVSNYADLNKIKVRSKGDISLDSFYTELSNIYPDLFDADVIAEEDQLARIIEVYESISPIYIDNVTQDGFSLDEYTSIIASEVFDNYFNVKEYKTFADKKQKEINELKLHYSNTISDMRKSYTRRYEAREKELQERIKRTRKEGNDRLIRQQAHFVERNINAFNRQKRTTIKKKIDNVKNDITRKLLNPSETSYVPDYLVKSMASLCDIINDAQFEQRDGTQRTDKIIEKLNDLHHSYYALKNDEDYDFSSEYDEEIQESINILINRLRAGLELENGQSLQVNQLSLRNLQDMYYILRDIKNCLISATQQIGTEEKISNHERGVKMIKEINATKGIRNTFIGRYEMETLNPIRAVRKITEYNDDAELYKLINDLNKGQRKADKFISDAVIPFEELRKDTKAFNKYAYDLIDTDIKDINGNIVQLTANEIVQLYMTMRRHQGAEHLRNGGFKLSENKKIRKSEVVVKRVNPLEVQCLYNKLDDYAKSWVSASDYLFSDLSAKAINSVSMQLKHKKLATTENYIPLRVDTDFTKSENEGLKFDRTIEGMGSLKSVVAKAHQRLIIDGLNTVVDKHIGDVANYYGLAIPIRNFNKAYNVQTSAYYDPDMKKSSVKNALRDKWGDNAAKLLDNLLTDLQTGRTNGGKSVFGEILDKAQTGFVQATLAGNISVAMKQAASYPTALANLSGSSLAAGAKVFAYTNKQLDNVCNEIDRYTGIHHKRRMGMSTQELGDLHKENALITKIPTPINPMKWIQYIDVKTTAALWEASKNDIKHLYPDIKVGSEEFFEKVTELYEDTIENTQPNYDVMHRPEIQKEKGLMRSIVMFKTQPLQNTGILYDSFFELTQKSKENDTLKTEESKVALNKAKKKFASAVMSQFLAATTFASMTLVAQAVYHKMYGFRDDDDEVTANSVMWGIIKSLINSFSTLLLPIGGGELYEFATVLFDDNYSKDFITVPVVETINDLCSSISDVIKSVKDDDANAKEVFSKVKDLAYSVSALLGIPAKNLVKLVDGIRLNAEDIKNKEFLKFEAGVERKSKQNISRYQKYFLGIGRNKDVTKAKQILDEMIQSKIAEGKTEEEAKESLRTSFTSYFKPLYQEAYLRGDKQAMRNIVDILTSSGLYVYKSGKKLSATLKEWEEATKE